jgi:hypothetical protein
MFLTSTGYLSFSERLCSMELVRPVSCFICQMLTSQDKHRQSDVPAPQINATVYFAMTSIKKFVTLHLHFAVELGMGVGVSF